MSLVTLSCAADIISPRPTAAVRAAKCGSLTGSPRLYLRARSALAPAYTQFDGYAPIMAYIGKDGYLVNTELREGSQHCQK